MTSELFQGNHLDQRSYISSLCRFADINKKLCFVKSFLCMDSSHHLWSLSTMCNVDATPVCLLSNKMTLDMNSQ